MKRYKLKRDLPTFSLGDEFILKEGIGLQHVLEGCDGAIIYTEATIEKFPNILTDWFEEIKEPTRWKPVPGDTYWSLDGVGYANYYESSGGTYTASRVSIGNCFQTKEEAERVVEYLKALAVVRGDATSKFTEDESNYYVYYSFEINSLRIGCSWNCIKNGIFGLPYFATGEDAQRSIEQHRNEWLTIFGVKEEDVIKK